MLRFLFILLAGGGLYFGWQWWEESKAGAEAPPVDLFQPANQGEKPKSMGPEAAKLKKPGPVPLQARSADRLLTGLVAHEAAAMKIGFREALVADEGRRGKLIQALDAAIAKASDVATRIRLLGEGNAFLHAAKGRKLLARIVTDLQRMDREKAIVQSTQVLEKCMRGPIAKDDKPAYDAVNAAYAAHKRLVDQVTFNPARLTKARSYKVKSGDALSRIAGRFRKQGILVDGWTLCFVNRIGRPNRLQAGKTIKIPVEPIWAKLEKASFLLAVYLGKTIVRLYWVGHGKDGCSTPETTFTVIEKLKDPDWNAPDGNTYPFGHEKNVLGRYFVKFDHESLHGFGAHGTTQPETIRTRSSLGCIRMRDSDIEEFSRFFPRRCKVVVAATR